MINFAQLEYAVALDEERNFVAAAKKCHVTQPTLSVQIKKLEEELGVEIFDRSKQPVIVSDRGKEVLVEIRETLRSLKRVRETASDRKEEVAGAFHLAVIPTLAPYLLPRFLRAFIEKYPKVQLSISELTTAEIIAALQKESIDCGLLATPLETEGLSEFNLFYEPFYLYLQKTHPLASYEKITSKDIHLDEMWVLEEGHCFRSQVLQLCGMKKAAKQAVEFQSGSIETLLRLTEKSGGYTLLPSLALPDARNLKEYGTVYKEFSQPKPAREISLVYARTILKRPIIEALGQVILESLPKEIRELRRKDFRAIPIDA